MNGQHDVLAVIDGIGPAIHPVANHAECIEQLIYRVGRTGGRQDKQEKPASVECCGQRSDVFDGFLNGPVRERNDYAIEPTGGKGAFVRGIPMRCRLVDHLDGATGLQGLYEGIINGADMEYAPRKYGDPRDEVCKAVGGGRHMLSAGVSAAFDS